MTAHETTVPADIAVIGIACRLPGASDPGQYWRNLREGVESIRFHSEEDLRELGIPEHLLANPRYVRASAPLADGEGFDAAFFGYSAREAEVMDPQHRHFLEVSHAALEDAGYDPRRYPGMIGVYAGCTMNTYLPMNIMQNSGVVDVVGDLQVMIGNDKEYLTTRVSYKLDLRGPSVSVQTACSSSLTAIHAATQAILSGECDMALAGGSSLRMPHRGGYLHQPGGTSSPDGHCRAFDADSGGSVVGNGAGVVVLKHLEEALRDGDHVYAVIKGTAINNDGASKASFTAPSVEGQARATASALLAADIGAGDIGFVEAHGTGTPLGDPIEVAALTAAYRESTDLTQYCALGSVKTNIGHLDAAAGVAGFLKVVLALQHRMIPPTLHFRSPNPELRLEQSPFFVNNELIDWESDGPRRAAVNSIGMGGSNAHVVVEEAPAIAPSDPAEPVQLLVLSANSTTALDTASASLGRWLRDNPGANLADVAYTLQVGRTPLRHRLAVAVKDHQDAGYALETSGSSRVATGLCDPPARGVALLFPGQGAQYSGMARPLLDAFPVFAKAFDECLDLFDEHLDVDLRGVLGQPKRTAEGDEVLRRTEATQPALFVMEYALAALLAELGVRPVAMLGHSIGEYVAATLAGVMSLPDAVRLVAARGRLLGGLPEGAMVAVPLSRERTEEFLVDGVGIAAVNGPEAVTISGAPEAVAEVVAKLEAERVPTQSLHVSHAFHSEMVDPILSDFREELATVRLHAPAARFLSNVTGDWADDGCADPEYWVRHLRGTVEFARCCVTLAAEGDVVVVEAGPGTTLGTLARRTPDAPWRAVVASAPAATDRADGRTVLLRALGSLWANGIPIEWDVLWEGSRRQRMSLPTYPFEHVRYWLSPSAGEGGPAPSAAVPTPHTAATAPRPATPRKEPGQPLTSSTHSRPKVATPYVAPESGLERQIARAMAELLGIDRVGVNDNFFELGADSLMGMQLIARLRDRYRVDLPMHRMTERPTVIGLITALEEGGGLPEAVPEIEPGEPAGADDIEALLAMTSPDELSRLLDQVEHVEE